MNTKMEEILKFAINSKASDVHLVSDVSPKIRVNGDLLNIPGFEKVENELLAEMVMSLFNEKQLKVLQNAKFDFKIIKVHLNCEMVNIFDTMIAENLLVCGLPRNENKVSLEFLTKKYGDPIESELGWRPQNIITIDEEEKAAKLLKLIDALEESDDVQKVFGNYELSEEIFNKLLN
jgi:transcriptional/translational regulatory protein YebC/TACO1